MDNEWRLTVHVQLPGLNLSIACPGVLSSEREGRERERVQQPGSPGGQFIARLAIAWQSVTGRTNRGARRPVPTIHSPVNTINRWREFVHSPISGAPTTIGHSQSATLSLSLSLPLLRHNLCASMANRLCKSGRYLLRCLVC